MSAARILIVEDEGLTAMGLQRKLKFWGYDVPTFVFSKKEAVKKAKEIKPDLILMDIVLKGEGDGIDAVREIKNNLDIPIIYLTAYSDEETIKRADITDPFDYIMKPFKENELHDSIEKALQKHKFEKKLSETGEWLDKKLKGSGRAVIVTDKEGYVKFMNQAAQKFTGFKREEAYFKDLSEVFKIKIGSSLIGVKDSKRGSPEFLTGMKTQSSGSDLVKDIITGRIVTGITEEVYLSNIEGKEIPIEYNASPIKDDDGEFLGATLVFNDISERVNAGKSLLESEKRFKSIYSQSPIGTAIYNREGQIIDANSAVLQLFGVKEISQLKEFNLFKDFELNKKEMLSDGKTVKYEIEFNFAGFKTYKTYKTTKFGVIYLEIIFKPLLFHDNISINFYLVQFNDITEHRTVKESLQVSKEMYKGLMESMEYPFIVLDSNLNCKYSNKESENLTGVSTDKTFGKSVWELLPDFQNPKDLEEAFKNSIETKKSDIIVFEYHIDNEKGFLELNINPLDDGLSILLKDVTTSKSREDELKKREKLYRLVVEDLTEPVCCFDPNGTLTYANKSYKKYFASGVVGSSFVFSIPVEEQEKMMDYIASFYEANPVKILESPIKMPDGNIQWWKWVTKSLYDQEGHIKELQSVGHEITEQRNLEAELNSTINLLEIENKEKTEYFESTKKSLKAELTKIKNEEEILKDLSNELEDRVKKTSSKLSKTQKDLKSSTEENKITEKQLNQTIEKLEKELDDTKSKFEETSEKLQKELNARIKIEEYLNQKYQLLEVHLDDVTRELSSTKTDMESEINKHIETKESIIKLKDELQKQLETKNSALERVNKDLNTEIAKRNQVENQFHITKEKLQKQLNEKQAKYYESIEKMESEIAELKVKYDETSKLLKEKEVLLKDVHTHAKKNMQRISSLTCLQSDYIRDQMVEGFKDSQNHIKSITLIHEKLYDSPDHERINFSEYVKSLVDDLCKSNGVDPNRISMHIQVENVFLDIDTATSCGLIINELVSNSIKHAFPSGKDGMVRIEIHPEDKCIEMIITDDGIGLSERVDFDKTDTLGLQLVKTLVAEINGKIELKKNYNGTKFKIKFNKN
jgi:PAS domain S-box-containing protein